MKINYKNAEDRNQLIDHIVYFYENNEKITRDTIKFAIVYDTNESLERNIFALISKADDINDSTSAKIILDRVIKSYGIDGNRKVLFEELTEAILKSNKKKSDYLKAHAEEIITTKIAIKNKNKNKELINLEMKNLTKKLNSLKVQYNEIEKEIEFMEIQLKIEFDL